MKKILVLLTDGFEEIEAMAVIDILRRAGVDVTIAGVGKAEIASTRNVRVLADTEMSLSNVDEFDGLILPGGEPGATEMAKNELVLELVLSFYNRNKLLGAICAAPKVFAKAGILSGKKATCYPGTEVSFDDVTVLEDPVVVDGHIITSRGPATAMNFAYEILNQLGYFVESENLQKAMLVSYYKEWVAKAN